MADSTTLSRDDILSTDDLEAREVEVEPWGGSVYVREMTGSDQDYWESELMQYGPDGQPELTTDNARAELLVRCIVDEDGNRVFGDGDAEALGQQSNRAIDRLFTTLMQISTADVPEVDQLAGN